MNLKKIIAPAIVLMCMAAKADVLTIPFTITPSYNQYKECTVIDANGDGKTWKYESMLGCFMTNTGNELTVQDDWLMMPAVEITDADKFYEIEFEVAKTSTIQDWADYIGVSVGSTATAEGMEIEILPKSLVDVYYEDGWNKMLALFKVPAPGIYYIGFHWLSDPQALGLLLRNVHVAYNGVNLLSPSAPSAIEAIPGEMGALQATLCFTLPTHDLSDNPLPVDETLTATAISNVATGSVTGKPGDRVNLTIATQQGNNRLRLAANSQQQVGYPAFVDVFTGVHKPSVPNILKAFESSDMKDGTIEWEQVTTAADGGYIDPDAISYNIYTTYKVYTIEYPELIDWLQPGSSKYTYSYPKNYGMEYTTLGVSAVNAAGESQIATAKVMLGYPYSLDMTDNITNGSWDCTPWLIYTPEENYKPNFTITMLGALGDGFEDQRKAVCFGVFDEGEAGQLGVPRFNTRDYNGAAVEITTFTDPTAADIDIYATYYGLEKPLFVGSVEKSENYANVLNTTRLELPDECIDRDWVGILIDINANKDDSFFAMTGIKVDGFTKSSSIPSITTDRKEASVLVNQQEVIITGCRNQAISICDITGKMYYNAVVAGDIVSHRLPTGIFIIRVGTSTFKVNIR